MSLVDVITLDVEGRIFKTFRSTLVSVPDSLLGKMFQINTDISPAQSHDGHYLIDACPDRFSVILNYLRYKELMMSSDISLESLKNVAVYFGLAEMVDMINNEMMGKDDDPRVVRLTVGDKILTTTTDVLNSIYKPDCLPPRLKDGSFLIVIDAILFEAILNFVTNGTKAMKSKYLSSSLLRNAEVDKQYTSINSSDVFQGESREPIWKNSLQPSLAKFTDWLLRWR